MTEASISDDSTTLFLGAARRVLEAETTPAKSVMDAIESFMLESRERLETSDCGYWSIANLVFGLAEFGIVTRWSESPERKWVDGRFLIYSEMAHLS